MDTPRVYSFDRCDEMTLGGLAVLAEVRRRLVACYSDYPDSARTAAEVVDAFATEIVQDARDEDDEDDEDDLGAAPTSGQHPAPSRSECPYCTTSLEDHCPWHLGEAIAHPDPEPSA